jgi:hypothetical protein
MAQLVDFQRRAADIREIAAGIFDQRERKVLLDFLVDLEKLEPRPQNKSNGSLGLAPLDAAIAAAPPEV